MDKNETLWKFKPLAFFSILAGVLAAGMFVGGLANDLMDDYGCDDFKIRTGQFCTRYTEDLSAIEAVLFQKENEVNSTSGLELEILINEIKSLKHKIEFYNKIKADLLCD